MGRHFWALTFIKTLDCSSSTLTCSPLTSSSRPAGASTTSLSIVVLFLSLSLSIAYLRPISLRHNKPIHTLSPSLSLSFSHRLPPSLSLSHRHSLSLSFFLSSTLSQIYTLSYPLHSLSLVNLPLFLSLWTVSLSFSFTALGLSIYL